MSRLRERYEKEVVPALKMVADSLYVESQNRRHYAALKA